MSRARDNALLTTKILNTVGGLVTSDSDSLESLAPGVTSQVLTVDLSLPNKIKWATPSVSEGLPVPANDNYVLTADLALPTKVKWAAAQGVTGPVSSINGSLALFNGTAGNALSDSGRGLPAGDFVGTSDAQTVTNKTFGAGNVWNGTDVAITDGGTGASTAQTAINNLSQVAAATTGHILTKVGSDAVWAAAPVSGGGGTSGNLLSVVDYGATGDGVTDDTTAIQNCINACFSTGKNMLVPSGVYLVTGLTMSSDAYANHFSMFGEGRNKTIIRKYATSSTPVLTIGDSTPAIFQANVTIEGIQFDGLNTTTAATVRSYDMVRSSFKDCRFYRGAIAYESYGAVANQFYNSMFEGASYGVKLLWASGVTSSPNETLFNGCQFVDNTLWGLYFQHGALCMLDACEIEGNGTAGNSSTGGVYVGSLEVLNSSLVNSIGVIAQGCWCEANAGQATFYFTDGRNTVRDCYFIANPNSTYEIYVSGGTYLAENLSFINAKTYHIYETTGVGSGNYINAITGSATFTKNIDTAKTKIDYTGTGYLASPYFIDQTAVGSNIPYYSGQDYSGTYSHNAYQSVMRVTRAATDYTGTPTAYTHCGQLDCMAVAYNASAGYQQYFTTDGGGRTMSAAYKARVDHNAKGDINGFFATISVNGHTNMASVGTNWTGGPSGTVCGGEVYANAAKVNIYGQEFQLYDNGQANVTTLGAVYGLYRTNATATLNNACTGVRVQSGGTIYADVGFQVSGNVKFGLDLTGMLYDANKAGIIMPAGSRIYMGAAATAWPTIVPTASGAYLETDNTRIKSSVGLAGTGFLEVIAPTTTSTASAGSASALPAVPFTYLTIKLDGVNYKIPVYNN